MYAKGLGVKQDYAESEKWYTLAADQGITAAKVHLILMRIMQFKFN
jgi:TPR repeat protein